MKNKPNNYPKKDVYINVNNMNTLPSTPMFSITNSVIRKPAVKKHSAENIFSLLTLSTRYKNNKCFI